MAVDIKELKAQVYDLLIEQEAHKKAFDQLEVKKAELLKQIKLLRYPSASAEKGETCLRH